MLSTYLNYKLINKDMRQSLNRVADQAMVARETKYYKENIGKVSSVNEFLADHRLYKFAMEAHGLDDMIYAKAFMRKVLESNLDDKGSFANRLSDERYRAFAKAFQGLNVGSTSKPDLQTDRQEDDLIGLYDQQIVNRANGVRDDTDYFKSALANVKNVDEFVADQKLTEYALKAAGIDPTYYSARTMKLILTSNPSDPNSYINSMKDPAYSEIVQALHFVRNNFNFTDSGDLPPGTPAQTAAQTKAITEAYVLTGRVTPLAAEWNTEYFTSKSAQITSVTQLMNDSRMLSYIQTAFGIESNATSRDDIAKALASDPSDPLSFANQSNNEAYRKLARLFNFQPDGQVPAGRSMLGERELTEVTATYMAAYDGVDQKKDSDKAAFYRNMISLVKDVDGLMNNVILYDYVLEAFGLHPDAESKGVIRQVLTSDLSDRDSFANRSRDSRYIGLAGAFNFGPDGKPRYARVAQSESEITATASAYLASATARGQSLDQAKAETLYYREKIDRVSSLSDLLKDKRLLAYVANAFGVTVPSSPSDFMERVMKSDIDDPKSFANSLKDSRFVQMAASFNFAADGTITQAANPLQSRRDILNTIELHTRQTLEKQSGEDNEGVRLALYFQRKAPEITSVYSILADRALQQVVFKALGLPDEMAQAPVDRQAEVLKNRLKIEDFKDPQKLEKFLSRFSALYDVANNDATPSLASTLFQGDGAADVGIGAMITFARLRASRFF